MLIHPTGPRPEAELEPPTMTTILFDATRPVNLIPATFGADVFPARKGGSPPAWSCYGYRAPFSAADADWWAAECAARYQAEAEDAARLDALAADFALGAEYERFAALGYLPV